jgi:uncharacterized protein (DUF1919 family)
MSIFKTIKYKKRKIINWCYSEIAKFRLKNKEFVIISNNCWGGDIYENLGIQYNSPFIGLFIFAPCYIKLLMNFSILINKPLKFIKTSKYKINTNYPIGVLNNDIEIHFLHYKSEDEAKEKWERRLKRMLSVTNIDKYYFKIDDKDRCNIHILQEFHKLPFKHKLSFSKTKLNIVNNFYLDTINNMVLLSKTTKITDVINWLNYGKPQNTSINRIVSFIFPVKKMWMK